MNILFCIFIFVGAAVSVFGAMQFFSWSTDKGSEYWYLISLRKSTLKQRKLHIKWGWNSGVPPEGAPVLVAEYSNEHLVKLLKNGHPAKDIGWAVMTRHGSKMFTNDGGYCFPVQNITGWLQIVEPHEGVNGDE